MRQIRIQKSITNRDNQSLETYLQEIGKVDLLTPDEEVDLAVRIKKGDKLALEKLVKANLRFVVSVAKQYQNQGLVLSDLINEGNLGLIKAAQRFDETRGFKFISYAVWWIRQSILQALADYSRVVRLPLNKVGQVTKITHAISEFEQQYERLPEDHELADELDIPLVTIRQLQYSTGRHVSLNQKVSSDSESELMDLLDGEFDSPDQVFDDSSRKRDIADALNLLSDRENQVVRMYFGIGYASPSNLESVGEHFGLTRERVRQIKDRAIYKLGKESVKKVLAKHI